MKQVILISIILFQSLLSFSQLSVTKKTGSSVVTRLGFDNKINDGSSLKREYTTVNDSNCPVQLIDVGIETSCASARCFFRPRGSLTTKEPIVAYEVVHLIYNVFGEHIKTLSNTEVTDIDKEREFTSFTTWYTTVNNISEYLICVSYVSNVRTKSGKLWHYNFKELKDQLNKLEIAFEEGYVLNKNVEKINN